VEESFTTWRRNLLRTGAITQDGDEPIDPTARDAAFATYLSLVDAVAGTEDERVFRALVESMTARHDYGAYEATLGAALRFPPERLGEWLYHAAVDGLFSSSDRLGDWLGQLAFLGPGSTAVEAFNEAWRTDDRAGARRLGEFVQEQEKGGWLSSERQRGVLAR
jgi:hypothetical protein